VEGHAWSPGKALHPALDGAALAVMALKSVIATTGRYMVGLETRKMLPYQEISYAGDFTHYK
jgi:hypothetical protein